MTARLHAGGAILLAMAAIQAVFEPTCWSQTAPQPRGGAAAPPESNAPSAGMKDAPKHQWEPGKITAMRDSLLVYGPAHLLAAPAVQEELGLSEKQREQLAALEQEYLKRRMERFNQLQGPIRMNGEAIARDEMLSRLEKWRALDLLLSKEQKKRLVEIGLQTEGPLAVLWPEIQDVLRLTPGQQVMLAEVQAGAQANLKAYGKSLHTVRLGPDPGNPMPPRSPEEVQEWVAAQGNALTQGYENFLTSRARVEARIARILTRKQKDRFNRMMGEPYDVSDLQHPGGGDWQPEDAKRYWERRDAEKAKAAEDPAEVGEAGGANRK